MWRRWLRQRGLIYCSSISISSRASACQSACGSARATCRLHVLDPGKGQLLAVGAVPDNPVYDADGRKLDSALKLATEVLGLRWLREKFGREAHSYPERDALKSFTCGLDISTSDTTSEPSQHATCTRSWQSRSRASSTSCSRSWLSARDGSSVSILGPAHATTGRLQMLASSQRSCMRAVARQLRR